MVPAASRDLHAGRGGRKLRRHPRRRSCFGAGAPAVHDQQLPLLVPSMWWLWLVDRWAFNGHARSFKAGNRGARSFKARSPAMTCSSRSAAAFPTSASVASRSSIVACWIPAVTSGRQPPRLGLPALAGIQEGANVSSASSRIFGDVKVGVRCKIAALWTAMLFLFAYGDAFRILQPGQLQEVMAGEISGMAITQVFLFTVSRYIAIASVMVFFRWSSARPSTAGPTSSWQACTSSPSWRRRSAKRRRTTGA
jgi:hypothetical protein